MISTIQKQFKLEYGETTGVMAMFLLGATVFGQILMALIVHFDTTVKKHVPVGTIMAILMLCIYIGLTMLANIRLQFHIQVSMGCTRTRFFVSHYLVYFAVAVTGWLMILAVAYLENAINPVLYANLECELYLIPYLWKWGFPVAVVLPVVCGFCGIMIMRFGRMAAGIMWVVWMAACLGLPNMEEAAENTPNSLFGKIGGGILEAVAGVPMHVWFSLAIGIWFVCLIVGYMIIRKLEVKP